MKNFLRNRKFNLRRILIFIIIVVLAVIGYMIYQVLDKDKPLTMPGGLNAPQPPKFLFHIYGDENNRLNKPLDVDVDEDGKIYVTDYRNREVKVFNQKGKILNTFKEVDSSGVMEAPAGIAVFDDKIYVTDIMKNQLYEFDTDGKFQRALISSDIKDKLIGVRPCGVNVGQNGDIYLTDILNHRVIVINPDGQLKMTLGVAGDKEGALAYPNDLAIDNRSKVYVSDSNNYRVQVFEEVYKTGRIFTKTPEGQQLFGSLTRGIAAGDKGWVWVVDAISHKVKVYDKDGAQLFDFGQFGTGDGEFNFPNGIAVKGDRIYVTDRENNRVCVFGYE